MNLKKCLGKTLLSFSLTASLSTTLFAREKWVPDYQKNLQRPTPSQNSVKDSLNKEILNEGLFPEGGPSLSPSSSFPSSSPSSSPVPAKVVNEKPTEKLTEKLMEKPAEKISIEFKATQDPIVLYHQITAAFQKGYSKKEHWETLKSQTLLLGGKAVPALIEVMKNGQMPERNRWIATFLLGQIMGEKAAPFLVKFLHHPNWVMRMAALKTLLHLKQKNYGAEYAKALNDPSLIVRTQALENIRLLGLKEYGEQVWAMLFDEDNYSGKQGKRKRSGILKSVIRTLGDLNYQGASGPFKTMIQKKTYDDLFEDLDYSLNKITGTASPQGDKEKKRLFWGDLNSLNSQNSQQDKKSDQNKNL